MARRPLRAIHLKRNMTQTQSSLLFARHRRQCPRARCSRSSSPAGCSRGPRHPGDAEDLQRHSAGRGGFLARQYKTIALLSVVVAALLGVGYGFFRHTTPNDPVQDPQDLRDVRHGVVPPRRAELGRRGLRRHVGVDPHEHPRRGRGDDVAQRRAADGAAGRRGVRAVHGRDEPARRRRSVRRALDVRAGRAWTRPNGRSTSRS